MRAEDRKQAIINSWPVQGSKFCLLSYQPLETCFKSYELYFIRDINSSINGQLSTIPHLVVVEEGGNVKPQCGDGAQEGGPGPEGS